MSNLTNRIQSNGTQYPDLSIVGRYGTPAEVPLSRVQITQDLYRYEDVQSLFAADGAPIAATGQGSWGQLYAAGRLY